MKTWLWNLVVVHVNETREYLALCNIAPAGVPYFNVSADAGEAPLTWDGSNKTDK